MKKALAVCLCLMMILLSGCNLFSANDSSSNARGRSADNPVPFGESIDVCRGKGEVQLSVSEVVNTSNGFYVKFKVKVVSLNGNTFSPDEMGQVLNNGIVEKNKDGTNLEAQIGCRDLQYVTFAAEGEAECFSIFSGNPDDCRCLRCSDIWGDAFFFAIR